MILIVDDKYSFVNIDNLAQPNEMKLCKKQKGLSDLFSKFFKSRLIFKIFEK